MKRTVRFITLILVLCQLVGCFAACKEQPDEEMAEVAFDLTKDKLSAYTIVVPSQTSENMNAVAVTLQDMIEKAIGVKPEIKTDIVTDASGESEHEILIGVADRKEAREFHSDVKINDSGYALVGKKVLILGHTEECANSSVFQFKMDILDNAGTLDVLMKAGYNKIVCGTYSYDTLMLNGTDISKYTIVYPERSSNGEDTVASYLQSWILSKTGYVVNCKSDSAELAEYEIQIGDTKRITEDMLSAKNAGDEYYIGTESKLVWISGKSKIALHAAYRKLLSMATEEGKTISLNTGSSESYVMNALKLSVMSYNVYYDLGESKRNPSDVIASVKQRNPDVFGLNEAGKDWINKFNSDTQISAQYACAEGKPADNAADASYNPIFYKKDKFELVEVQTKWLSATPDKMSKYPDAKHYKIFTYVILKDKVSGTEFMYINVHLDGSNDSSAHAALKEVRKKQADILKRLVSEYSYLPAILGGDFNEGPTSNVIVGMSNGTRFKYCMNVAEKKIDINSTDVNSSYTAISDGVIFDYLFVTSDCITVQKYEQWDNKVNGKYPSDHLPVCAEITIMF